MAELSTGLEEMLTALVPLESLSLPVMDSLGCVLAEDVRAPDDIPAFATVAIDGYAVKFSDHVPGKAVRVIDEVPAGFRASEHYLPGTCIRVARGAPLPDGTDTVVEQVHARVVEGGIVLERPQAGHGVVQVGALSTAGAPLARAGQPIDAETVGTLARAGIRAVEVHPRPRVLVVTVGTEYVEPGVPTPIGLVADHLSQLAAALVIEFGATAFRIPPVLDDRDDIRQVVDDNAHRSDVIVLCGVDELAAGDIASALGLSSGDPIRGRSVMLGMYEGSLVVSLPDDPAALVATARAGLPRIIARLMGRARA